MVAANRKKDKGRHGKKISIKSKKMKKYDSCFGWVKIVRIYLNNF